MPLQNWARNLTFSAPVIHRPETMEQLRDIVTREEKLRVIASRHSFNTIADSPAALVSTEKFNRILEIDSKNQTVAIEPGVTYGALAPVLHDAGFALHNLASLPHISVAGATATATHGSGVTLGNLTTAIHSLELLTATGESLTLTRGDEHFPAIVHLGALGVITKLTLDIQPTFNIRQLVYEHLPFSELEKNLTQILSAAYSVSLFTDWSSDTINQVWLKHRIADAQISAAPKTFFSAVLAPADRHPIASLSAENCTVQQNLAGPWHERLPHFRMDFTPSSGDELQAEYFVPLKYAVPALGAIRKIRDQIAPLLLISEIRTIAADSFWLSPCYQNSCLAVHFTLKPDAAVMNLLPKIESALAPFSPRPHWAKLFAFPAPHIRTIYQKLPDFLRFARQFDPSGKFQNPFLDTLF